MTEAWPPVGVRQRLIGLKGERRALRDLPTGEDIMVEQALARYLAVRSAGYIEAVRDDVSDDFVRRRSAPEVASRVRVHLRTGLGVTPEQLLKFVGSFSFGWQEEFVGFLDGADGELRRSLGALVAARKAIAHGNGERVTTSKSLAWSNTAEQVGAWLIKRFEP